MSNCIFCNKEVVNKTKEHVIPKWLLKKTDNPSSRTAYINNKGMSFSSYTFPACKSCNEEYSKLEEKTRIVFEKIFLDGIVNTSDLSILLDWFDKIRVGIWYGELQVNNKVGIKPNFGIQDRIKSKDRLLAVSRINKKEKGINIYGTEFSAFTTIPSFLGFRINDLLFLSISNDFVVSRELGLPYVSEINSYDIFTGEVSVDESNFKEGSNELAQKFISYPFSRYCTIICQPILKSKMLDNKIYTGEYMESIFHDFEEGIGKIFIKPFNEETQEMGEKEFNLVPNVTLDFEHVLPKFINTILHYQKSAVDSQLKSMDKIKGPQKNIDILNTNLKTFQSEFDDYLEGKISFVQDDKIMCL